MPYISTQTKLPTISLVTGTLKRPSYSEENQRDAQSDSTTLSERSIIDVDNSTAENLAKEKKLLLSLTASPIIHELIIIQPQKHFCKRPQQLNAKNPRQVPIIGCQGEKSENCFSVFGDNAYLSVSRDDFLTL